MKLISRLLWAVGALLVLFILILPVGISVGSEYVSFEPTPEEQRVENRQVGITADTYRTTVLCKYFVTYKMQSHTMWSYSDSDQPDEPTCDRVTFYWHDGWLIDPGTHIF